MIAKTKEELTGGLSRILGNYEDFKQRIEKEQPLWLQATGEETPEEIDGRKSISGTISLGEWKKNNSLSMDKYVGNLFGESIVIKEENQTETIYTYSPLANLKKAVFKCKEIKYNDNGRIKELVFEER